MKQDIFNQARLEISCDLADYLLEMIIPNESDRIVGDEELSYTEIAQDKFNELQSLIEEAMISFAKIMIENEVDLETLSN